MIESQEPIQRSKDTNPPNSSAQRVDDDNMGPAGTHLLAIQSLKPEAGKVRKMGRKTSLTKPIIKPLFPVCTTSDLQGLLTVQIHSGVWDLTPPSR